MSHNDELLAAELELLADEAQLGRGVSAQRACLEGRRILRRRRAIGTTGGVGATGLALALAVVLLPAHAAGGNSGGNGPAGTAGPGDVTLPAGARTDGPDGPAPGPAATTTRPPTIAPTGQDPLKETATFGWLPTGFAVNGCNTNPAQAAGDVGPGADSYGTVYEISAQTSDGTGQTSMTVLPAGTVPVAVGETGVTAAPVIDGRSAYWQTSPTDQALAAGEVVLDWQYRPDTWAELSLVLGGSPLSQAESDAVEIAQEAQFNGSKAVPLPFRNTAVPPGLTTVTAGWEQLSPGIIADATWQETLSFANGPGPAGSRDGYSALEIGVTANELPAADVGFTDPTGLAEHTLHTTVDGHTATIITATGYTLFTVDIVDGFGTVEIQGTGAEAAALAAPGAAAALFDQLDLLGMNQSGWTTAVLK